MIFKLSLATVLLPFAFGQSLTNYTCSQGSLTNLTTVSSFGTNATQVNSLIGTFQEISWQSPIVNVTGADNAINATRAISAAGEVLVERLVAYNLTNSTGAFSQTFEFANGPLTFAALGNVTLYSYLEHLQLYPITACQSIVIWDVVICSSNATTTGPVFQQVHETALGNITAQITASQPCGVSANATSVIQMSPMSD